MNKKTYYQILGVTPSAKDMVIRAAYKALSQLYHPDKYKGSAKLADKKMKEINIAYYSLSDKKKRKIYDKKLYDNTSKTFLNSKKAGEKFTKRFIWS